VPGIRRLARIDLEAFATHVAEASLLDGRADAYGHSLELIAPAARDAGVTRILVSDERDAAVASAAGLTPVVGRVDPRGDGPPALGAAAYGLVAGARPVLTLTGEILAGKNVGAGAGVSYGYTYRTAAPTRLALVGLGYADGVPRSASNRAQVAIGGQVYPLVGRIAMDQFVVDCGGATPPLGGEVVLFGGEPGVPSTPDWAAWTGRSPLALTAGLGPRIRRIPGGA
jgi:alanine racemase